MPPSPPVLGICLQITRAEARSDQKVCKQRHLTTTLIQRPLSSTTLLGRYWNVTVLDVTEAKDTGASGDNSQLVVGHFFKTQPNPTQNFWAQPNSAQPTKVFTRPNPTQPIIDTCYGILGYTENFIQQPLHVTDKFTLHSTSQLSMKVIIQLQCSLTDSRVFHDVKNVTQSTTTQPNPTQPMDGPNP